MAINPDQGGSVVSMDAFYRGNPDEPIVYLDSRMSEEELRARVLTTWLKHGMPPDAGGVTAFDRNEQQGTATADQVAGMQQELAHLPVLGALAVAS